MDYQKYLENDVKIKTKKCFLRYFEVLKYNKMYFKITKGAFFLILLLRDQICTQKSYIVSLAWAIYKCSSNIQGDPRL